MTNVDAALLSREWQLTLMQRHAVATVTPLAIGAGPLWVLMMAGTADLRVGDERVDLREGDAALVAPGAGHRVVARAGSDIVTADLRPVLGLATVPSPIVIRGFAQRHVALRQLVETCPLGRECSNPLWTRAYANMLGAAMLTAWMDDRGASSAPDTAVAAVLAALAQAPGDPWTLERMARIAHLSRSALTARFRAALGKAPSDVLRELRMNEARDLLADQRPVGAVASAVGYGSTAAFSRAFSSHHGVAPQAWRSGRA